LNVWRDRLAFSIVLLVSRRSPVNSVFGRRSNSTTEQIERMRGRITVRGSCLVLALLTIACTGSEPVAPLVACQESITVTVGSGPDARFDWTPACGVYAITVVAPPTLGPSPAEMWVLVSDSSLIAPGVRYGEVVPGSRDLTPAYPVTSGTNYKVAFAGERGHPPVAIISWIP